MFTPDSCCLHPCFLLLLEIFAYLSHKNSSSALDCHEQGSCNRCWQGNRVFPNHWCAFMEQVSLVSQTFATNGAQSITEGHRYVYTRQLLSSFMFRSATGNLCVSFTQKQFICRVHLNFKDEQGRAVFHLQDYLICDKVP